MSVNEQLRAFLERNPNRWFSAFELAQVAGYGGWRSRISDMRLVYGMAVEWNRKGGSASRHRYVPPAPRDLIEIADASASSEAVQ